MWPITLGVSPFSHSTLLFCPNCSFTGNAKSHTETEETIFAIAFDDQKGNQNSKVLFYLKTIKLYF